MIANPRQPDALVARMASLADPTRLRLLRLLERHELGVAELCDVLQCPQSTVSRHLKVLSDQGWTRCQRNGTTNLYRMPAEEIEDAATRLWDLAREQTEGWATAAQDDLRLARRLADRPSDAQAFFAGAAGQWDLLRRELYGESFTFRALATLLPGDWVVADLGCGSGEVSALLAPRVGRVLAVDQSGPMLKAAGRRLRGVENVELIRADLASLPLPDAHCDAALVLLVLTYVEDPAAVLCEARRVLRPGGKLVAVDLLTHDRDAFRRQMGQRRAGFTDLEFRRLAGEAGFSAVDCAPLPPGPALLMMTAQVTAPA